jgi:hypothetical protein
MDAEPEAIALEKAVELPQSTREGAKKQFIESTSIAWQVKGGSVPTLSLFASSCASLRPTAFSRITTRHDFTRQVRVKSVGKSFVHTALSAVIRVHPRFQR